MSGSRSNAASPGPSEHPLGSVELTSTGTFGVRAAALAGYAVSAGSAAGRPSFLEAQASWSWPDHISCSSVN
jgi:hypothetical protein